MTFIIFDSTRRYFTPKQPLIVVKYVDSIQEGKDWIGANTQWGKEPNKYRIKRLWDPEEVYHNHE